MAQLEGFSPDLIQAFAKHLTIYTIKALIITARRFCQSLDEVFLKTRFMVVAKDREELFTILQQLFPFFQPVDFEYLQRSHPNNVSFSGRTLNFNLDNKNKGVLYPMLSFDYSRLLNKFGIKVLRYNQRHVCEYCSYFPMIRLGIKIKEQYSLKNPAMIRLEVRSRPPYFKVTDCFYSGSYGYRESTLKQFLCPKKIKHDIKFEEGFAGMTFSIKHVLETSKLYCYVNDICIGTTCVPAFESKNATFFVEIEDDSSIVIL